jgi:hypothetical protein
MKGSITLYFEECNGTAGFVLESGEHKLRIEPNSQAPGTHSFDFEFNDADNITMYMIGKNQSEDTTVSPEGDIVQDKHVKIIEMQLQHLIFDADWLYAIGCDPYFGFNEKPAVFEVPQRQSWPHWYLDIMEKLNG